MTSLGPDTQSYDFSHMYNRLLNLKPKKHPPTQLGLILEKPEYSKFRYILKLSGFYDLYTKPQGGYTLFICENKYIKQGHTSIGEARDIIKRSTLNRLLPLELISASPKALYSTKNNKHKILISTEYGKTYINEKFNILSSINNPNFIIHFLDGMIESNYCW